MNYAVKDDYLPSVFEDVDSRNKMQEILGQHNENIRERVPNNFLHALVLT